MTQVFARRGYNVQSLAVGPSEREGMSRICMVVPGKVSSPDGSSGISPLLKQLSKLVFVQNIVDLTDIPFVNREMMLIKVRGRVVVRVLQAGGGESVARTLPGTVPVLLRQTAQQHLGSGFLAGRRQ